MTVLVNADQTFMNLHYEDVFVVAPRAAKRVGSTIRTDEKQGVCVGYTGDGTAVYCILFLLHNTHQPYCFFYIINRGDFDGDSGDEWA